MHKYYKVTKQYAEAVNLCKNIVLNKYRKLLYVVQSHTKVKFCLKVYRNCS